MHNAVNIDWNAGTSAALTRRVLIVGLFLLFIFVVVIFADVVLLLVVLLVLRQGIGAGQSCRAQLLLSDGCAKASTPWLYPVLHWARLWDSIRQHDLCTAQLAHASRACCAGSVMCTLPPYTYRADKMHVSLRSHIMQRSHGAAARPGLQVMAVRLSRVSTG